MNIFSNFSHPKVLFQNLNHLTFKSKMILLNSLTTLILIIPIALLLFVVYKQTITEEIISINFQKLEQTSQQIDFIQKDTLEMANIIINDYNLQNILKLNLAKDESSAIRFSSNYIEYLLNSLLIQKDYLSFISISTDSGYEYYVATDASNTLKDYNELSKTSIFKNTINLKGAPYWSYIPRYNTTFILDNKSDKLNMSRSILNLNDLNTYGILNISISTPFIKKLLNNHIDNENASIVLIDENRQILFEQNNGQSMTHLIDTADIYESIFLDVKGTRSKEIDGTRYIIAYSTIESSNHVLISIIPFASLDANYSTLPYYIGFLTVLALIIGLILTSIIASKLNKPISTLLNAMAQVDDGNLEHYVEINTYDEIGRLALTYNQMISKINNLVNKVYVLEIEEKVAELKSLQSQINPHFLYNTLDTIYWKACAGDQTSVQNMIQSLSKMFRLTLNSGHEITYVSNEITFIIEYFSLQKMRFRDKLIYSIDIPDEMNNCAFPKLILQPFVENAIVHGMEEQDLATNISVKGYKEVNKLVFLIVDNGKGMTKDKISKILHPDTKVHEEEIPKTAYRGGYGIKNIIKRLDLYYDGNYQLEIMSEVDHGTTVKIVIPDKTSLTHYIN